MSDAVIGSLRGVLGLDTADFDAGVQHGRSSLATLRGAFIEVGKVLEDFSAKARNVGLGLTAGLTVPAAALASTAVKSASTFEKAMKNVEAALKGVSGKQLDALSAQARDMGPRVGKGATEAANGIESLGLAGLSTADILGGGLKAALDLAAAGAVEVAPAAALVTDAMGQFKVTAAQLPTVVQNVVGALDASKFGFQDFADAAAAGGGIAASAGVSFADFSTAIAATSAQFSSGSDAGTSFKSYIQSLIPISDDAERAMKALGIEFFDLKTGRMKPLAEQAEILRNAFTGLSDKSKTDALKTIFGSDAARTAIGLMEKGRKGIEDMSSAIAGGDVSGKIAKRMEGEAAASNRIAVAFESAKIAIGNAGLLELVTTVKNAFASLLEKVADASPFMLKVGVAIGAVAAALGPLVAIIVPVASFLLAKFVRGFGLLGEALAFVISPISTVVGWVARLAATAGAGQALGALGGVFLRLAGPIALVTGAFVILRDSVLPVLAKLWETAQATLGPPLEALMTKLGGVFTSVVTGPIGTALGMLGALLSGITDVVGTMVAIVVTAVGEALVDAFEVALRVITGVVDVVSGVVSAVGALLSGDFAGAWDAALGAVDSVVRTIIDIVGMMVPDISGSMELVYDAAKAWLSDGFASIGESFVGIVDGAVAAVSAAFPGVVDAARSVYVGVKSWLVDSFGGIMAWVGRAAKWIGDKYGALKERLGLGGAGADSGPEAPPKPAPAPPPGVVGGTRNVSFEKPKPEKKGRAAARTKKASTFTPEERRDDLKLQTEMEAARERGDVQALRRMQDVLDLRRQIEAYEKTGLTTAQARVAAEADMKTIAAARAVATARQIVDEQQSVALDVAQLTGAHDQEAVLQRQEELRRRILFYSERTKDAAEAERLASADQARIDAARAEIRSRWVADDAAKRARDLAALRGANDNDLRTMDRKAEIIARSRDLQGSAGLSERDALAQATAEDLESEKARMAGTFRSAMSDGVRAAMDGNLKGFAQDWFKNRMAKGMEDALNSLSKLIERVFANVKIGSTGGGGGGLGGILGSIGKLFGVGAAAIGGGGVSEAISAAGSIGNAGAIVLPDLNLPKFATGGSFRVGGQSGIDRNVVSMRLSKGEMVDIRKPGQDLGRSGGVIKVITDASPLFDQHVERVTGPSIQSMGVRAAAGGAQLGARRSAQAARRRIPG